VLSNKRPNYDIRENTYNTIFSPACNIFLDAFRGGLTSSKRKNQWYNTFIPPAQTAVFQNTTTGRLIMPLITEHTRANAEKCKMYVDRLLQGINKSNVLDTTNVLSSETEATIKGLVKALANAAPYRRDFEKVYGKNPYDYFMDKFKVVKW